MDNETTTSPRELVVLIGLQAAGKSTFYRTQFAATHDHVSKDLLRNNRRPERRQLQLLEEALQAGHSVVVDNTNATREARAPLIVLGRAYGAHVTGYAFAVEVERSRRRNQLRSGRERVPDVAIFATRKRLENPAYEEGFDQLYRVRANDDLTFEITGWSEE